MATTDPKTYRLVGYFPSWGIHAMKYGVADIPADRLDYVVYAFADVSANNECVSVNVADDKINFPQLAQLKQQHPKVQVLISVGGASHSTNFATAAASDATRLHFAQSCVQFMKQNGFDGIDIDWEYPTAAQKQSFTALLGELRRQLDAVGATDRRRYTLTIAAPASASNAANLELNLIHPSLDWINLMAYDFTVASSKVTDFVAPLRPYDPAIAKHAAANVDSAVQAYLRAGVPADKLVVGTRFVGTGWRGVPNAQNGLYQNATGPATGTWDAAGAAPSGSFGYQDLKQNYLGSYARSWHADAAVPWLYNPSTGIMISYEDLQSLTAKAEYVVANRLGGIMVWELSADDALHSLISVIAGIIAPPANAAGRVSGGVIFEHGLPAGGLSLRVYSRGFGGADTLLAVGKTDDHGNYALAYAAPSDAVNLEVRAVDTQGNEIALSTTKYQAAAQVVMALVAPERMQPLAPEFQRLAADMDKYIGGIAQLSQAQESAARRDLTLINQSTSWDARLVALAASAARQATATGLGQETLYALFRVGLPVTPEELAMVPPDTVKAALTKASQAGVVGMSEQQIATATTAFQTFATNTRLAMTTPGAVSRFGDLLTTIGDATQRAAFANLYFSTPTGADLWKQAAALNIPAQTLDALKLQGKFLHLTFNNAPLAQRLLQDVGALNNLPGLASKDYHDGATWKTALTAIAGAGGDQALQKLIPAIYRGSTTERLDAYAADLARKVRLSFPTHVVARMIERKELGVNAATATNVTAFLRAAAPLGYELGRTPLNAFIKRSAAQLPAMDKPSSDSLKTLHRLYQVTPSPESLQSTLRLGFASAHDIASYAADDFMNKYANSFPSESEAWLVYQKSQQVTAVTFNFFSMAKHLDTTPAIYGLSAPDGDRQDAKNAVLQQFPTMTGLFGSLDFCQCEHCRSVLSPAAYFVDLLEFLNGAPTNPVKPITYVDGSGTTNSLTPLDVLIGNKDAAVAGRRPDLAALPLTCANTNTAMPYIDLVNEILEYYIANNSLDAGAAYDTGNTTTADLTAEPQHILPQVYDPRNNNKNNLKTAVYPLNLPFDLWIETVRGFLAYFKTPFAQVLDVLRPAENLELFTDASAYPYYRSQIFAESLGLSPAEYGVLTVTDPATQKPAVQAWFQLYGFADEASALAALPSAKTLAQRLGLSYQEVTDLITGGFVNPSLSALIFQFERFGVSLGDAFAFTGQPGYTALAGQAKTDFEALLDGITARYKKQNPASTFNARAWLTGLLPANYSKQVLLLRGPSTGCDFSATVLQYADGSAVKSLDFLRLNLFVRLWKKLGWSRDETDRALQLFFPAQLPAWTDANFAAAFSAAWKTALAYTAHLDSLTSALNPALGRAALLPLWSNLPTQGTNPLYAQLFLTPGVLANDRAFDDPAGQFPGAASDPLASHQAVIQGVLGLTADEIATILADAGPAVTTVTIVVNGQNTAVPGFSLTNLSMCYRYSMLAKALQLPVADAIALMAMAGLNPFRSLGAAPLAKLSDDVLFNQTLAFVNDVAIVQKSGFTVADLQYLLRHRFDPVGKYRSDANALMTLVQRLAAGIQTITAQNALPADMSGMSENLIEQRLSGLFPAQILKTLFSLLTNSDTYQASQGGVAAASKLDPLPFAGEAQLGLAYDAVTQTQTLTYRGLLPDWKKNDLLKINNAPLLGALLSGVQQQAQLALSRRLDDVLGVWASLAEYEAAKTGMAAGIAADPLTRADPAVSLSYDQSNQLQSLAYRGVLTDAKKAALVAVNNSNDLLVLLNGVQQQGMAAYRELAGSILAMWVNVQSYEAVQAAVAPADKIDPTVFAAHPEIQLAYDAAAQRQTLTFQGVLTDANRTALAGLVGPPSAVLANLLQNVRNQAVQLFQTLATNVLTVTGADIDGLSQPFLGVAAARQQKQVKAELVKVFQPLLTQKLCRELILQSLAADLGSDPSLTGALITDAGLLTDPNNPGKSLLSTFLAIGQQGVSVSYYAVPDFSQAPMATAIAVTPDTADATNPNAGKAGTGSARFEGYLQVPTDGPYRFFAELGDQNAQAVLQLDSPDPRALLGNPIIKQTAGKNNDEASQFVELKGGLAYHFTLDLSHLGANGARLLIQGETLPKGTLSQVVLYPQAVVAACSRARVLAAKVLQLLQAMSLDEREVSYLTAHALDFGNLRLSALPTQASDDSLPKAIQLFAAFLALADYADLRKGPAGGSDGLVDVLRAAALNSTQEPDTPWTILANLTRRDPRIVRDVATALGPNSQFANTKGIRRLWQTLQLVQVLGIPVTALASATAIVAPAPPAPDAIAANLQNAVKARYTPGVWRSIAQSIFDKLRRRKRDALVAYLVNGLALADANQLFEYFLVDPGMEPVVQTSRLRLALSSVQTFVQRCLLNLEAGNAAHPERNVVPDAIRAEWWDWMKRYRVWEANRKIFLFPENWMEPELRLDKTDLFQAIESALLQGDVTRDLVEDAFLTYLKGLDVRARLDIVAMYLDQDQARPDLSTLYVLGRTYGTPHKYFYRTYASGAWSGWVTVTLDIESNHIALMVWRGGLNLFWLSFVKKAQAPPAPPAGQPGDPAVVSLPFGALADSIYGAAAKPQVQVQLHWSEYFQGTWSNRISTDVNRYAPITVFDGFDPDKHVYIHVSKETDVNGNEGAAKIHLDVNLGGGNAIYAFRVSSKNCDPDFGPQYWQMPQTFPYNAFGVDATLRTGSGSLQSSFETHIASDGSGTIDDEIILDGVDHYAVLPCANPIVPPFLVPTEPLYQEAGALVGPFFYKDTSRSNTASTSAFFDDLTFFVQPSLTEKTIVEWDGWAVSPSAPAPTWIDPKLVDRVFVVAQVPVAGPIPVNPPDPAVSLFAVQDKADWATNPATAIAYGDGWIGKGGAINPATIATSGRAAGAVGAAGSASAGARFAAPGLALIGKQGLRPDQIRTMATSRVTAAAGL